MMRTDAERGGARPRGAVLWPLGLLLTAVASGFGMWYALMRESDAPAAAYGRTTDARLVQGASR